MRDERVLCATGVRIGRVTRPLALMPDFGDEEFRFAPAFKALYEWWLICLSVGKKGLFGEQGFLNFLLMGIAYRHKRFTREEMEIIEEKILVHLRIVLSIYEPE